MKTYLLIASLLVTSLQAEVLWTNRGGIAYGEHLPAVKLAVITLLNGQQYQRCQVFQETYGTITFRHAAGLAKVEKNLLPDELKKLFPLDPAKAETESVAIAEARERDQAQAEKRQEKAEQYNSRRISRPVKASPTERPVPTSTIMAAAKRAAEKHYKDGRKNGSGQTLVFGLEIDLEEPRPVPGWTGRYEVKGEASYNYYESIKGGAFSSNRATFTCQIENGRVVDFSPGF